MQSHRTQRPRKATITAAATAILAVALSSCGSSDAGDGKTELRFYWWGGDARQKITQDVIAAYEESHPDVDIQPEFGDWSGYWDKLATTVAANDAPDIIQMDEKYLREYAGRGALLEMPDSIDTSKIEPTALETGQTDEGLFAMPAGINSYVIIANPAVFEEAGVEMPDDSTWTWEDYEKMAKEITENTPEGTYGSQSWGNEEASLNVFARQHGESLYTPDGKLGLTEGTLTEYFETMLQRTQDGVTPPASSITEDMAASLEQSDFATGQQGMMFAWSNQLNANSQATGSDELQLLRLPSDTGKAEDAEAYYKGSMFWSISARSEHPEEAAEFVNYLANNQEAADILLAERGAPPNSDLRKGIADQVGPADAASLEYIDEIGDELGDVSPPSPVGGGSVQEIFQRYASEVVFERQTPAEAAKGFLGEVTSNINQ